MVSASLNNEDPPCFVKNSVADVFPPTFMVRNWLSCQESRLVDLFRVSVFCSKNYGGYPNAYRTKLICTPMFLCTLEQSRHIYTPKVTLDHVGFRALQSKHDFAELSINKLRVKAFLFTLFPFCAFKALNTCSVSCFVGSAMRESLL